MWYYMFVKPTIGTLLFSMSHNTTLLKTLKASTIEATGNGMLMARRVQLLSEGILKIFPMLQLEKMTIVQMEAWVPYNTGPECHA